MHISIVEHYSHYLDACIRLLLPWVVCIMCYRGNCQTTVFGHRCSRHTGHTGFAACWHVCGWALAGKQSHPSADPSATWQVCSKWRHCCDAIWLRSIHVISCCRCSPRRLQGSWTTSKALLASRNPQYTLDPLPVKCLTVLRHSFVLDEFCKEIIVPLLKSKHGNALSPVLSKVFESVYIQII